jgi:hypothetical protein
MSESVSLAAALKDPMGRDPETEQMDMNGHIYIYRYLAGAGIFLRATLPSGAAAPVFRSLRGGDKVPVEGWIPLGERPPGRPRMVRRGRSLN